MRKTAFMLMVGILSGGMVSVTRADDIKDNFQANLNQPAIDALTKDLGSLVGGGTFHSGKALGFPIGFDVGAHAVVVGIRNEDTILRDNGSTFGAGSGQAEIGLPFKINLIGRVGTLGAGTFFGGGLRYGILKPSVPGLPDLSISALYNKMSHDFIDVNNYCVNAALSFDLPIIHPYIGGGYDHTELKVESKAYVGAPANAVPNLKSNQSGYRAEVGINLSIIPFTYITIGGGLANGETMYHAAAGVVF